MNTPVVTDLNTLLPYLVGFSVMDDIIESMGGTEAAHEVFKNRLYVVSWSAILVRVPRVWEREQWAVKCNSPQNMIDIADYLVSWEETEDVDIMAEITAPG